MPRGWVKGKVGRMKPGATPDKSQMTLEKAMDDAWEKMIADLKTKYPPDGERPRCDHDWNNEGINPTHCLKCGMSIMAHAMMECP